MVRTDHKGHAVRAAGLLGLLLLVAQPAPAQAAPQERLVGRWVGAVPCVPTAIPSVTGSTTCAGSTTWIGGLTGQTHYTYRGTVDLVTGAGRGSIDETFVGRDQAGRVGTLRFAETVVALPTGIPDTGSVSIDAVLVDGTGDFAGAAGRLSFNGLINVIAGAADHR